MPRHKKTDAEKKEAILRANEWRATMAKFLITEKKMADLLEISRRSVQMIRGGNTIPSQTTLNRFAILKSRYESGHIS